MNSLRIPKDLSYSIIIRISRLCNLIVTHSEKRRTAALLVILAKVFYGSIEIPTRNENLESTVTHTNYVHSVMRIGAPLRRSS